MEETKMPCHVAVIADGNRRWAREKGLPTIEGHRRGADNFVKLSRKAKEMGIKVFTLWGFSTENWSRAKEEVGYLMGLFELMLDREMKNAQKEETRIVHLGRKDRFSPSLLNKIREAEETTKHFTKYNLAIALDYGGKDEIGRALNRMLSAEEKKDGFTASDLEKYLDTAALIQPNPDLIIRTSGEERLSGFMPLQSEYSEFYFTPAYFPDFGPKQLEEAVKEFIARARRFGK